MCRLAVVAIAVVLAQSAPAGAQSEIGERARDFRGLYAGPEAGLVEHHFYIRETNEAFELRRGRYYRSWSAGGGLFIGYDLPIGQRISVGAEASVGFGGASPEAHFPDGSFYAAEPRFGYKFSARAGRRLGERTLLYGSVGYGGHRYRIRAAGVGNPKPSGHSFTIGAGVEHRLSSRIGVRLDFRHLDNQMSQWLIGVPVRF